MQKPLSYKLRFHPAKEIAIYINFGDNKRYDTDVFTDGSKQNNKVGCAFIAFENNLQIYNEVFRLGDNCSVYQSELFAILKCLEWIKNNILEFEKKSENKHQIGIYSDSQSALISLQQVNSDNSLVHQIKSLFKQITNFSKVYVSFNWVKGHSENYGNDSADLLAKHGFKPF